MDKIQKAVQIIESVESGSCILFLSLGKDSLVLLDLLYPRFKRIVCVYMYFVKGLEHIERWIRWVKVKYPGIEFVQVPHWNLSYILKGGLYCVPDPKVKLLKLADVVESMRRRFGIEDVFLGMKKADSMNRRLMLKGYAENGYKNKGLVYPLAEWTQKEVLTYMRHRGLPEPVRYSLKASNGIGFNIDCLSWLDRNFPQDLQRIYRVFPMCERQLWERRNKEKLSQRYTFATRKDKWGID